ncbi:MAG TPA: DNA repair protein RecN [Rhodothermales bacterium]|nr:DNA repair protein RecN [Rhodothermales bacterium]
MLRSLYIKNFALIEELEVHFHDGFNVLTGETGAGKSILIGALQLILGARASTDFVRTGEQKATVEGIFDVPGEADLNHLLRENGLDVSPRLIVRRELTLDSSRTFVNDSPVTLQIVRDVTSSLVDLHGQHDHQSLLKEETHLELLDSLAGTESDLRDYQAAYREVTSLRKQYDELSSKREALQQGRELASFQIEEIDRVGPLSGEEEELENELRILENVEELVAGAAETSGVLYTQDDSVYDRLAVAVRRLEHLARIENRFEPHLRDLESAMTALSEVGAFLRDYGDDLDFDPNRIEEVRDRLGAFEFLKRKYGGSIEAVLELRERVGQEFLAGESFDETLSELKIRQEAAERVLGAAGRRLSESRRNAAPGMEQDVVTELGALGMPAAVFNVRLVQQQDPTGWARIPDAGRFTARPDGIDECSFHISTNRGEPPKPLVKVASGGEVSRIMLALKKVLARGDRVPTLVFDEIDTGISGAVAQKVGQAMRHLATHHQIIAITHLPQIAAMANVHFRVRKNDREGRNVTTIELLSPSERTQEVASLLSGAEISPSAIKSAEELISLINPSK